MTQKYDVVLDAQLGQRFGTLVLDESGDDITGSVSLLGFDNPVSGTRIGRELVLSHMLRTMISALECETHVELRGDELFGVVISQYSRMNLHGKRQEEGHNDEISEQN